MNLKLRTAVVAVSVVLIGLVAGAAPASARQRSQTIHVGPGQSIQAALDAANPGDTVDVAPGTYAESLVIAKDGIRLVGHGTTVTPGDSPLGIGILVADVDLSTGEFPPPINHTVTGVTITGITIDGQSKQDIGVFVFGASHTGLFNDVSFGNNGYGFFANTSTGTVFANDVASGGGEAGFYVGDSPDAKAVLWNVESFDNLFGIFIRDAQGVTLVGTNSHDNCLGMLVLADNPGPAGDVTATFSSFSHNQKACPADAEEGTPPFSGIGVAISGGHDVRLIANNISDNVPTGDTIASAGVALVRGDSGTAPTNISVVFNRMRGNSANLFDDGSTTNLIFRFNG
jgi:Right handed beta helix region